MITFFFALAGLLLTAFCLKEPSGRTLEDISGEDNVVPGPGNRPVHA
ncbi:hypothetical protein F0726_00538 [Acidithiobacillus caldus]|nr:hypothetical protein F0726_00538 [Acidithiobacillus caldus]